MNRKVLFIAIIQFIVFHAVNAQTSDEFITRSKSSFKISSNSLDLKATDQILVLETTKATNRKNGKGKYRFAYQSIHLEFSVNDRIENFYSDINSDKNKYKLSFFDSNNNLIISVLIPAYYVNRLNNPVSNPKLYFYSIDLLEVPRIIINNTDKIDIIKLVTTK